MNWTVFLPRPPAALDAPAAVYVEAPPAQARLLASAPLGGDPAAPDPATGELRWQALTTPGLPRLPGPAAAVVLLPRSRRGRAAALLARLRARLAPAPSPAAGLDPAAQPARWSQVPCLAFPCQRRLAPHPVSQCPVLWSPRAVAARYRAA